MTGVRRYIRVVISMTKRAKLAVLSGWAGHNLSLLSLTETLEDSTLVKPPCDAACLAFH